MFDIHKVLVRKLSFGEVKENERTIRKVEAKKLNKRGYTFVKQVNRKIDSKFNSSLN